MRPVLAGLLLLLAACDPQSGEISPQPLAPSSGGQDKPLTLVDDREDVIQEIEEFLVGLSDQIREMSVPGILDYFPGAYAGSPLLGVLPPDRSIDRSLPGYRIETWDAESSGDVTHARLRDAVERFFKSVATIDFVRFRVTRGERRGDRFVGMLKFIVDVTLPGGGILTIRTKYETEFQSVDGNWRILNQARVRGRRVRTERPAFADVTEALGIKLDDFTALQLNYPRPFYHNPFNYLGGTAVGDVDGDGFPDILVMRFGGRWLLRSVGGRSFEDITMASRVWSMGIGSGALFFDADNDGDLDLLALNYSTDRRRMGPTNFFYINDGTGHFENVTRKAGMEDVGPAVSATAADIDLDGDLDVYVTFYQGISKTGNIYPMDLLGATDAPPNRLWVNNGNGTFVERGVEAGVGDEGWSLAAAFGDYNNDGLPDLYVANDFGTNRLFRNLGGGKFEDVTKASGVADLGFGMGANWGDFDGDGFLDLYISNMYSTAGNRILNRGREGLSQAQYDRIRKAARGNTLLRNKGDGTFEDVTERTGVGPAGWAWDTHFFDYNNDGRLDVYVACGFISGKAMTDM